jgi:hypothetical protein
MKFRFLILLSAAAAICPASAGAAIAVEHNIAVKMRDGVILRADIYRPGAEGKYPVILHRTPYNRTLAANFGQRGAEAGFVVVLQDVRGRYASGGEWYPLASEFEDGYDSVEWAASLPYCNGRVGVYGGSYHGYTALMAALSGAPHLAAFVSLEAGSDFYDGFTHRGGALQQWLIESWTTSLAYDTLDRAAHGAADIRKWADRVPLTAYPVLELPPAQSVARYLFDWLRHPSRDAYWDRFSFEAHYGQVRAPGVHIGGWYDAFGNGPPHVFNAMRSNAATPEARRGQRLIMGPWSHGPLAPKAGDLDFGKAVAFDVTGLALDWFDYLLRGAANGLKRKKPVQIFVMGENVWREEDEWPLARARETAFYLHSDGKANSGAGTGTVSAVMRETEAPDEYTYDPTNPVPTAGGGLCCGRIAAGAIDQRAVESRSDVLVYTTPPLEKDLEVTGPVRMELFISSSAPDTDFTATLVDVWPNGYAQNVADGMRRARYRESFSKPQLLKPGTIARISIDMWATSNLFRAGHRLRVHVTSSNFPRYDRNPNTGEEPGLATRMIAASNRVYHDRGNASAVFLPIVPR